MLAAVMTVSIDHCSNDFFADTDEAVGPNETNKPRQSPNDWFWSSSSSSVSSFSSPRIVREGWLWKKKVGHKTIRRWNRRWFVLSEDGLSYFRRGQEGEKKDVCNTALCTLRRCRSRAPTTAAAILSPSPSDFTFEVVTPSNGSVRLQASDESDFSEWTKSIENCIVRSLSNRQIVTSTNEILKVGVEVDRRGDLGFAYRSQNHCSWRRRKLYAMKDFDMKFPKQDHPYDLLDPDSASTTTEDNGGNSFDDDDSDASICSHRSLSLRPICLNHSQSFGGLSTSLDYDVGDKNTKTFREGSLATMDQAVDLSRAAALVEQVMLKNHQCADCGHVSPDWASLNLGVVICITCSGVHRSLGAHRSKVRSLRLDHITNSEARLLLALGNRFSNNFRSSIPEFSQVKNESAGDRIRRKYTTAYRAPNPNKSDEDLMKAVRRGDVQKAAMAVALGADVRCCHDSMATTALHECAAREKTYKPNGNDNVESNTDDDQWKWVICAEFLIQNGARLDDVDVYGETPLDKACDQRMLDFLRSKVNQGTAGRRM